METTFKALLVSEANGSYAKIVEQINTDQLVNNEVLIKVHYSSVNYKDALSASGNKGVTKKFPHVPGIDAAGVVVSSSVAAFKAGQEVIVTGFDLGMNTWGGFGAYISVPASWLVPLPAGLSLKEAMAYGTAGFTAALSVHRLVAAGITPQSGTIAVSGATGGVGSIAIALLSHLGYQVMAISGKANQQYLTDILGAKQVIGREEFTHQYNQKPMATPALAGGIDTVGGNIVSGMLKATQYGGTVTCCVMVASNQLDTSIFPFILRGVTLAGIDSVLTPMPMRTQIWNLMASSWKPGNLLQLSQEITLTQLPQTLDSVLNGQAQGRYIVRHDF